MPRRTRHKQTNHENLVDDIYGSVTVRRLIKTVLKDGKEQVARGIVYEAINNFAASKNIDTSDKERVVTVIDETIEKIIPAYEVITRRMGGAATRVPVQVSVWRRGAMALRNLVKYAKARKDGKSMKEKLSLELQDIAAQTGGTYNWFVRLGKEVHASRVNIRK